jgi:hypothetical protein
MASSRAKAANVLSGKSTIAMSRDIPTTEKRRPVRASLFFMKVSSLKGVSSEQVSKGFSVDAPRVSRLV